MTSACCCSSFAPCFLLRHAQSDRAIFLGASTQRRIGIFALAVCGFQLVLLKVACAASIAVEVPRAALFIGIPAITSRFISLVSRRTKRR